jgi:peptidoglycan/LPS O-acetylase OafA/YrhL
VRTEIQGLRALAVALVVVYHLWPHQLPGGYVGVDLFFLISGYLITGHIVRPLQAGTFTLTGFFVRRALRLLPASLLTLVTAGLATIAFVPMNLWTEFTRQIAASGVYLENWVLAANSVDYSALSADASPVQHFWSLSTEEQFYIVWPLLLLLAWAVGRSMRSPHRVYAVLLGVVAATSLAVSVIWTATDPASAYFSTATRAWEFAAGGLLWLLPGTGALPTALRRVLGWLGLVVVLVCAVTFDSSTAFPGVVAAIPLAGGAMVISAGGPVGRDAASMLSLRPVQFIGDISYSLYLWHWPLIVILPFALHTERTQALRLLIVAASVGIAYLARRYVELPVIRMSNDRFRSGRPVWPVYATTLVASALIVAGSIPPAQVADHAVAQAMTQFSRTLERPPACLGAAVLTQPGCAGARPQGVVPSPLISEQDSFGGTTLGPGCQVGAPDPAVRACTFGDAASSTRIALVGDSHAAQWEPALQAVAKERGWALTTYVRSSCPLNVHSPIGATSFGSTCIDWNAKVMRLLESSDYRYVFVSSLASTKYPARDGLSGARWASSGFASTWRTLQRAGRAVIALRDTPNPQESGITDITTCVAQHQGDPARCDVDRREAVDADPQLEAARAAGTPVIDMLPALCREAVCPAVVGGVMVYRDRQHITATYSRTMADALDEKLSAALRLR